MKASELIQKLTEFVEEHGDLDVWVYDNGCGGHYNCEPYQPIDVNDGVRLHLNVDGPTTTRVARLETEW